EKNIEKKEYEIGKKVWNYFRCKTFEDYLKLYLVCDVLILADCFEKFRETSLQVYKIDPCHFFSAPSLSWNAMLLKIKEKNVELEQIVNYEMAMMIKDGIRGGLSCIVK